MMDLTKVNTSVTYIIKAVEAAQEDMQNFLFTLGCYPGEEVTVISKLQGNYIINVKDARYSIDQELANAIFV